MAKQLLSGRTVLPIATLAILVSSALLLVAPAIRGDSPKSPVEWDERASKELAAEFHRIHVAWNKGDTETVKRLIAGDDVLVTFELGTDGSTPIALRSKKDINAFFDGIVKGTNDSTTAIVLEMPKMNCRATSTFGVCTEECTVRFKSNDNSERVDKYFGTAVAVKYPDGWKWIQYHMSTGGRSETHKEGKVVK